ncbi:MAG: 4-(cytidine 5'-diphospho)-2-C-methyl-D-erythritol kinase [Defluviitaleaceae bacterium]|nr:4-(cytidine 5'-diphospho)-2-C-methyl-D-erythritol kinase [Defluviitaleaceae bacterium]
MNETKLYARAKINIGLDILGKREDGYHNLVSVMQSVYLADEITVKKIDKPDYGIKVSVENANLPQDERNLAYKTALRVRERYGIDTGIFINLKKNIPVAAGLGGGSSDAAAVLIALRNLYGLNMDEAELYKVGLELGADVPFCLTRGTCLAEGVGERLRRLNPFPPAWFLLVKPPVHVSTADIFNKYSVGEKTMQRPDMERLLYGIRTGDLHEICREEVLVNVFEPITGAIYPVIYEIKKLCREYGALGASMSGSGSTVFGVFIERESADNAARRIKERLGYRDIIVTRGFNA